MDLCLPRAVYDRINDATDLAVYLVLVAHANREGRCWPSYNTIAKKVGMGRTEMFRAIKRLEDQGLITTESRMDENQGRATNMYSLVSVSPDTEHLFRRGTGCSAEGLELKEKELTTPSKQSRTRRLNGSTDNDDPPEFARWWHVWPRKEDKKDALKIWARINPSPDVVDRMIAAVVEQRIAEREHQYQPLPTTWLNKERWKNPAPPTPNGKVEIDPDNYKGDKYLDIRGSR